MYTSYKNFTAIFLIAFCITPTMFMAKIRLVLSAALTNAHFEFRKQQYIDSFALLKKYDYGPEEIYVVEALKKQPPTFLDNYSNHVFYATTNNPALKNQGVNEAKTLLESLSYFNFDPDDIIIKLTGRYQLISDYFLQIVTNNPTFDAFVKLDSCGQVITACFAMRCKYFQDMYQHIDYHTMERCLINEEQEVAHYIQNKTKTGNFKVLYVDKLDLKIDRFGSSTAPHISNTHTIDTF